MVVGSGVGDSKIITLIAIPFSEHSVEGEGDNGQTVGDNGGFRPGGVDFTGGDILDVVFLFHIIVLRSGIAWWSVMNDYVFGGWSVEKKYYENDHNLI